MTWKRELAFWSFMFFVMLGFMVGLVHLGAWISNRIPVHAAVEARG
jgi:hypothetical protein